ncbi:hypothetical protein J4442_00105 [Candidatus Woesearchaeota archaeon]|nr:hypothetical protein [Candidatus Woesearchaeota archaeon]
MAVVLEDENHFLDCWLPEDKPIQIYEGISLRQWKRLDREYLKFKKLGEFAFRRWIDRVLYRRLELESSTRRRI